MNFFTKCNCCSKENVCKFKEQYQTDCKTAEDSIHSDVTEITVKCKEFLAKEQIIRK